MESDFVDWLRRRLPASPVARVGPGDDAAVLRLGDGGECVVTIDMLTDGVDFQLDRVEPRRIGHKALAVNLSDLAAMAARPLAAFVAVALPRRGGAEIGRELVEGFVPLAERYHVALAGGDTNSWDGPLVISVTAIGQPTKRGVLLRSGARPGDRILVTGSFGGSILGRHLDFEPRVNEALLLNERYTIHAAIDVSDGLSLDLVRMARESGCGAVIDLASIPVTPAAEQLARQLNDGSTPLDHALGDGEDFELILAVPPDAVEAILLDQSLGVPVTCIGEFIPEVGLWTKDANGRPIALASRGFEHSFEK